MRYIFARLNEKRKLLEILKIFRKFSKFFLRKLLKVHYFGIFSKNLTNHALNFCAFGRKKQIVGKF